MSNYKNRYDFTIPTPTPKTAKRVFPKDDRTTREVMEDFYKNGFQ